MIWIILGVLPIVLAMLWLLFDDPEGFFFIVGILGICTLMATSLTYGLYQVFG